MNDYSKEKNKCSINLKERFPEFIKSYYPNKKTNIIEITFFNGEKETWPLSEENITIIDQKQKEQLKIMQNVIIEHNNKYENKGQLYLGLFETIADVSIFLVVGLLVGFQSAPIIMSIGALGVLGLGGLDIYKVGKFRYKLVKNEKNIQLATYLDEHRQEATEIIRQEVDALRELPPTQNIYYIHPKDAPYSEKLYEQGLTLSTIDELSIKQQKQLRKIIKKRD